MTPQDRYDSLFRFYGEQSGVDWRRLKAQAMAESGLDPNARSKVGAAGLAQFMAATREEWRDGVAGNQGSPPADLVLLDPRDPEDAIRAQAAYMGWLLIRFPDNPRQALAAYNWGLGRVTRAVNQWGVDYLAHTPAETQAYVARIERTLSEIAGESA